MSHFGDYMDGVPVKISEKYKRPPRIDLPYSVIESPIRAQNLVDSVRYCTTFEKNVLLKLKELRSAKVTKKNERRHRLQLLEEAKQKKLDAIAAAEAEAKLKQLSVSEVSYPSTDELSALSPDEKLDKTCDTTPTLSPDVAEAEISDLNYPLCTSSETQNILQPIQVQSNYTINSLLDDPDPLQELKLNTKIVKIPQYNHNVDTLTYKDFENDTSSPFDNVELKTINDMELLAQVLQSQKESINSFQAQSGYVPDQIYNIPNCVSQTNDGLTYLPRNYSEQPIQGSGAIYSPQNYSSVSGYYLDNTCDNTIPENINIYMPNYQYYVPINPNTYNQAPNYSETNNLPNGTYISQPYYFQPPQMQYPTNSYDSVGQNQNVNDQVPNINTVKSRSRSVPDIVKELNEELVSAKLRANERSYNASPAPNNVPKPSSSSDKKEKKSSRNEYLLNPYDKLSLTLQNMCQQIHGMGFPLDRVARVCTLIGDNDKKVIESLLIMGELMDLGFSEERVSAALAKHEFNRDKALDELVS